LQLVELQQLLEKLTKTHERDKQKMSEELLELRALKIDHDNNTSKSQIYSPQEQLNLIVRLSKEK